MAQRWIPFSLVGALLLLAGCFVAEPVVVRTPPPAPAPPAEFVPAAPSPAYLWLPGHWAWRGPRYGYVWVGGHWAVPHQPGWEWVTGHWAPRPGGYVWVEGHWRAR